MMEMLLNVLKSEIVYGALIGMVSGLVSAGLTHRYNLKLFNAQATRDEQRRNVEWHRERSQKAREQRDLRLSEIWEWALIASARMGNTTTAARAGKPLPAFEDTASFAAAKAYAVALLAQPEIRDDVKKFHVATMGVDPYFGSMECSVEEMMQRESAWSASYRSLEDGVKFWADYGER